MTATHNPSPERVIHRRPRRKFSKDRTKEAIFAAALAAFQHEDTYEDVRLRDIAKAADRTLSAVLDSFESKVQLFAEVYKAHAHQRLDLMWQAAAEEPFLASLTSFFTGDYRDATWLWLGGEIAHSVVDPRRYILAADLEIRTVALRMIDQLLDKGRAAHGLHPFEFSGAAELLWDLHLDVVREALRTKVNGPTMMQRMERYISIVIIGVRTEAIRRR